jgi:cobalamin biosynthesis protein CbiD
MTLGTFDEGGFVEVVRGIRGVEPSEESSSGGMTTGAAAAAAAAAAVADLASHSADVLGAIVKPFAAAAASTVGVTM